MIRNLMALPGVLALVLACGPGRPDGQDTGAGSETGAMPADTGYTGAGVEDTTAAPSADVSDTAAMPSESALPSDSAQPGGDTAASVGDEANQDQSGVTNTESGESELGDGATKTSPDAGEPVTSKGDTVGTGGEGATSDTAGY
jgi:hypothetical protein